MAKDTSTSVRLEVGDCLELLPRLRREGVLVDAVVTDPPYHLASVTKRLGAADAKPIQHGTDGAFARASAGFMGQKWDGGDVAFRPDTWKAVMALMKPGAWLVAFGGTRTFDLLVSAVRAAGFEVRDRLWNALQADEHVCRFLDTLSEEQRDAFALAVEESRFGGELAWMFGSGFPKPATTAAKAIDKHRGVEGETVAAGAPVKRMRPGADQHGDGTWAKLDDREYQPGAYVSASEESAAWEGWGFALKPAHEPILLARKPLDGSGADCLLRHGTGALNIGGCRIEAADETIERSGDMVVTGAHHGYVRPGTSAYTHKPKERAGPANPAGRWPANVVHDGSEEVLGLFPDVASNSGSPQRRHKTKFSNIYGDFVGEREAPGWYGDSGSAARFFYCAKATASERVYRCRQCGDHRLGKPKCGCRDAGGNPDLASHPTVKPLALMRWLVRLVCPPGGLVLDPFAGTGTTGAAARAEGMGAVLIERERAYAADICVRLGLPLGDLTPPRVTPTSLGDPGPLFRDAAA